MKDPLAKNIETWDGYALTAADVESLLAGADPATIGPPGSYQRTPTVNEYGVYPCRCGHYPEVRLIESFVPPCPMVIKCYQCPVSIAADQPLAIELWNHYALCPAK